jgi:WD40 repeat protein
VIVSGSLDGSIRIWDLERGQELGKPLTGHTGGVTALAVAQRQGQTVIVSGSEDGSIRIWSLAVYFEHPSMDLGSLRLLRTIEVGATVYSLTFPRPSTLVVGTSMGLMPVCLYKL